MHHNHTDYSTDLAYEPTFFYHATSNHMPHPLWRTHTGGSPSESSGQVLLLPPPCDWTPAWSLSGERKELIWASTGQIHTQMDVAIGCDHVCLWVWPRLSAGVATSACGCGNSRPDILLQWSKNLFLILRQTSSITRWKCPNFSTSPSLHKHTHIHTYEHTLLVRWAQSCTYIACKHKDVPSSFNDHSTIQLLIDKLH